MSPDVPKADRERNGRDSTARDGDAASVGAAADAAAPTGTTAAAEAAAATPSAGSPPKRRSPRRSFPLPRTFQGRLSLAFVGMFVVAVGVVSGLTVFILDRDLRQQEVATLEARARAVAAVVKAQAEAIAAEDFQDQTVVSAGGQLNTNVASLFGSTLPDYANQVALADLRVRFGLGSTTSNGTVFIPANEPSTFTAPLTDPPGRGQNRDSISYTELFAYPDPSGVRPTWYLEVSVSAPYTTRASTVATVVGFLSLTAIAALVLAILLSALLARRFTAPLRRLTEAARGLAEGDLDRRVPTDRGRAGAAEITELSRQFNTMASQVQATMDVIVRDRDRSREFLADVSHELRTPLAALRTFNELLQEKAGDDPVARAEFLESSAQQLERLDWLAQNLLELSKLDSGLVRLDLRPDDLRATVLSAVEQAEAAARRRGVELTTEVPDAPLIVRHDPPRIGQVVSNLVGNALKFTPRGGSVRVRLAPHVGGGRISVIDTGVGIDAAELPHIFDRFYRGSRAHEARSSGSGLGLAIVRSVVEMHGGRIAVESRAGDGSGSTFTVTLPADPRSRAEKAASSMVETVSRGSAQGKAPAQAAKSPTSASPASASSAPISSQPPAPVPAQSAVATRPVGDSAPKR
jgi:two-component system, OmpR family, sensor histidine kinase BaeS